MRDLKDPERVFFFVALLSGEASLFDAALQELAGHFGMIAGRSGKRPWSHSIYYEEELGKDLLREFVFFDCPRDPDGIVQAKHYSMEVERNLGHRIGERIRRRINIDPGYMTRAKLVLASSKDFSHRIYIGGGVYAEVTLHYKGYSFRPFFTTYPDYREEGVIKFFNGVRSRLFTRHSPERKE